MASKVKETIKAGSIARVISKATGKTLGFLVRSDNSNEFYQVTCTRIADVRIFTCTCKAGQTGFINCTKTGYCKHVAAVLEIAEARAVLAIETHNQQCATQQAIAEAEHILNEKKQEQEAEQLLREQTNFNIVDLSFQTGLPLTVLENALHTLQGYTINNLGDGNFHLEKKPLARDLAPLTSNANFTILK